MNAADDASGLDFRKSLSTATSVLSFVKFLQLLAGEKFHRTPNKSEVTAQRTNTKKPGVSTGHGFSLDVVAKLVRV